MSMRVEERKEPYIPPKDVPVHQEDEEGVYDQPVSSGPNLFEALWSGFQGLIGKERLLEDEKKSFAPKWEDADFVGKLEMVLHLREEITLSNCQNAEAIGILSPFLEAVEFEPVFADLYLDRETVIGAVHDSRESGAKDVVGRFRDHLDTYLTHVMREAKKMMAQGDVSSRRKVLELFKMLMTEPKPEDQGLMQLAAFRECYQCLPDADRVIWREAYCVKGARGSDQMLDYGIQHADFLTILGLILSLMKNQGAEDPHGKEKDLALMDALSGAQVFHQRIDALRVLGLIKQYNRKLLVQMIQHEQTYHVAQGIKLAMPREGYIGQNPLSEIARHGVAETIKALK